MNSYGRCGLLLIGMQRQRHLFEWRNKNENYEIEFQIYKIINQVTVYAGACCVCLSAESTHTQASPDMNLNLFQLPFNEYELGMEFNFT